MRKLVPELCFWGCTVPMLQSMRAAKWQESWCTALWYTVLNHGTLWYTVAHGTVVQRGTLWCTALSRIVSLALCLIGQGQPHPCYGAAHPTNPSKSLHTAPKPLQTLAQPLLNPLKPNPPTLTLHISVSLFSTPPVAYQARHFVSHNT